MSHKVTVKICPLLFPLFASQQRWLDPVMPRGHLMTVDDADYFYSVLSLNLQGNSRGRPHMGRWKPRLIALFLVLGPRWKLNIRYRATLWLQPRFTFTVKVTKVDGELTAAVHHVHVSLCVSGLSKGKRQMPVSNDPGQVSNENTALYWVCVDL